MKILLTILISILGWSYAFTQVGAPESVIWNELTNSYIISDTQNGKLVSLDKAGNYEDFTTGLNQPKGLTMDYFSIWVTDLRQIVEIDAESGDILNRYQIIGSGSLNDVVAADGFGYLYITDTQNGRVYRFDTFTGTYQIFSKSLIPGANGIYYDLFGGLIVVAFESNAKIYTIDIEEGNVDLLMQTQLGQLDGITYDTKRDRFYISSWGTNSVYILDPSFEEQPELLKSGLNGPADIFYDELSDTLVVPVMNAGEIVFIGFPKEQIEILGEPEVCEGQTNTYRVDSSGDRANKWYVAGGDIVGEDNLDSVVVSWLNAGSGEVKIVQSENQSSDSAMLSVTINALPAVEIKGIDNVCEDEVAFYFAVEQTGLKNVWEVTGGEVIGDLNSDTLWVLWKNIPEDEDSLTVSGFISLTQTNRTSGCSNSNSLSVGISKRPVAEIQGSSSVCVLNTNYYYTKSEENYKYEWQINGGTLIGNSQDTVAIINWEETGEATLTLIKTNELACSDTTKMLITIHPRPNPIISQDSGSLICTPAETYQWYYNDEEISGANEQRYTPLDTGEYSVQVSDENGCTNISEPFYYHIISVENKTEFSDIMIYPNPVNDKIYISGNLKAIQNIEIYNLLGVLKYNFDSNINYMDVLKLPNGIYLLKLTNEKDIRTFFIVKE